MSAAGAHAPCPACGAPAAEAICGGCGGDLGPLRRGAALAAGAAEARYGQARRLAEAGELVGAMSVLLAGPATGDGLLLFGLCALHLGQPEQARAALLRALVADPSNARAAALLTL